MTQGFKVKSIGNEIWAIDDHGRDVVYLVEGEEKCLLIDTGWGVGDLRAQVEALSPLPVVLVNTHAHVDHISGNGQFDAVYVHTADEPLLRRPMPPEFRSRIIEHRLREIAPPGYDVEKWNPQPPKIVQPVEDGHLFDLGERVLEVIHLGGHSPGSICLLDRRSRLLFTGDTVFAQAVWMHLPQSLSLRTFHENLVRLQGRSGEFDGFLPAHGDLGTLTQPKGVLDELIDGVASILMGECVGREVQTGAGPGLRCDFDSCAVVYRADRLEASNEMQG